MIKRNVTQYILFDNSKVRSLNFRSALLLLVFVLAIGIAAAVSEISRFEAFARGGDSSTSGSGNSGHGRSSSDDSNSGPGSANSGSSNNEEVFVPQQFEPNNVQFDSFRNAEVEVEDRGRDEIRFEIKEQDEDENELLEEDRIRIRDEQGRDRVDVVENGIGVRFEERDDRFVISGDVEFENDALEPEEELLKIDDRADNNFIKVEIGLTQFFLPRTGGQMGPFPLILSLNTNELFSNTPSGLLLLTVLDDQVVRNTLTAASIGGSTSEVFGLNNQPLLQFVR